MRLGRSLDSSLERIPFTFDHPTLPFPVTIYYFVRTIYSSVLNFSGCALDNETTS